MKLIVGLGNPGKKYADTWHNLGFSAVDELRGLLDLRMFKKSTKFQADIAEGTYGEEKIILAKPLTFMNNSGDCVQSLMAFYKITPADLIVIQDDIDLLLGKMRLAVNSSAGGHNGIKSIIEKINDKKFIRIKIGVRTAKLELIDTADYVLIKPDKAERQLVKTQIKKAADATKEVLDLGLTPAMNNWN